ncbi:MAG TPA: alkaline shock response membrane anchor protein AmaP [Anaerolineae bacterium]|nr:alkaline shock response membrane anchor protein AmaP [Anaerolineae bacterium]
MNAFNRIVVVLLIILLIAAAILVVAAPQKSFDVAADSFGWLSAQVESYQEQNWPLWTIGRVVAGAVSGLLLLLLLWLEFRRKRVRIIRAQKLEGGDSFIAVDSISQRLAYTIDQLPDVVRAVPRITRFGRNGLDLDIALETAPEIDVPVKTAEVLDITKEVITERMGLRLGKVQVKIRHSPYPKR